MYKRKTGKRLLALLILVNYLLLTVLGTATVFGADNGNESSPAKENVITIESSGDFEILARNCALDTYSEGISVVLLNDINIKDIRDPYIPIFAGSFDGNGHKITGLNIKKNHINTGLFGTLTETACVVNLTIEGEIDLDGISETCGAFCGANGGIIKDCRFKGDIDNKNYDQDVCEEQCTGGIAGINKETGTIIGCVTEGNICGIKDTGGIAGMNYGCIARCENNAVVNKHVRDSTPKVSSLLTIRSVKDVKDLLNYQTLLAAEDTGGIAGYSEGSILMCSNTARVGIKNNGYNIGGIVGRTDGFIYECHNSGNIEGDSNIGGIVGVMEPSFSIKYASDMLLGTREGVDEAFGSIDGILDNVSGSVSDISETVSDVIKNINAALKAVSELESELTDFANAKVDEVNRIMDTGNSVISDVNAMKDAAHGIAEQLESVADDAEGMTDCIEYGVKHFKYVAGTISSDTDEIVEAVDDIFGRATPSEAPGRRIVQSVKDLVEEVPEDLYYALSEFENATSYLNAIMADLKVVTTQVKDLKLNDISGLPHFSKLSKDIDDSVEEITGCISNVLNDIDKINGIVNKMQVSLTGDIRKLSSKANTLIDSIFDFIESVDLTPEAILINGDSADERNAVILETEVIGYDKDEHGYEGLVFNSVNEGDIRGVTCVGGIAGTMEFTRIPSILNDIKKDGFVLPSLTYSAAIRNCRSTGCAQAEGDNVGLICGKEQMGAIISCTASGGAKSDTGSHVGGIVGQCHGLIKNCSSRAELSGEYYVGGIAGSGSNSEMLLQESSIENCAAYAVIEDCEMYMGAISGSPVGNMVNNRFVDTGLYGSGDYNVEGGYMPVSESEFISEHGNLAETPKVDFKVNLVRNDSGSKAKTVLIVVGIIVLLVLIGILNNILLTRRIMRTIDKKSADKEERDKPKS